MFDKLIDVLLSSLRLFKVFQIVRAYEAGVILRFGHFNRLASPGLMFLWPLGIEEILVTNVVTETMNVGPQSLTTRDGRAIVVTTVVTFRVSDPRTFLLSIEGASQVIEDCTFGAVAAYIMSKTWGELREIDNRGNPRAYRALKEKLSSRAQLYGVEIEAVSLGDFSATRSLRLLQQLNNKFGGS